jgi:predicted tellurium resistance membrane protein TerC
MEWLVALVTLTVLEIVLGIDNVIFISILAGKLPAHQQGRARSVGLMGPCCRACCCSFPSPG